MRSGRYVLNAALLVIVCLTLLPALQAGEGPVPESPEVSELLTRAKTSALRLSTDADTMASFTRSTLSWESHAEQIHTITQHVNNLGAILKQLDAKRGSASPWQREAIDRVTPLAKELASDIETTIKHINDHPERLHSPKYQQYVSSNAEVSAELAKLIADFVALGKSKAKYQQLETQLEVGSK